MHPPPTPRVIPPPCIFLVALGCGVVAQQYAPVALFARPWAGLLAGGVLTTAGLALSTWVMRCFRRSHTPVSPLRPTRQLVMSGPYRFSRNPDYIGQALVHAGLALALNALWPLLSLLPALALVRYRVIGGEERYLRRLFGKRYARYCRGVRRWL